MATDPTTLRQLPYARRARELLRSGRYLARSGALSVYMGPHAWGEARHWLDRDPAVYTPHPLVVVPPGEDPRRFDWRIAGSFRHAWLYSEGSAAEAVTLVAALCLAGGAQFVINDPHNQCGQHMWYETDRAERAA